MFCFGLSFFSDPKQRTWSDFVRARKGTKSLTGWFLHFANSAGSSEPATAGERARGSWAPQSFRRLPDSGIVQERPQAKKSDSFGHLCKMKETHPGKRLILPIFIPHHGCPHRCIFCNQEVTTDRGAGLPSKVEIERGIASFLQAVKNRPGRREVAFYGGSFTALPFEDQEALLTAVHPFVTDREIDAIRVSTRPDAIDARGLELLMRYGVETVEVGAPSMVDEILQKSWRGHTRQDVVHAVELVRSVGFEVGVQIMLGLPGEVVDLFLTTVRRVIDLSPDFVRIYPLLVIKGSPLGKLYEQGFYVPTPLDEALQWAKRALKLLERAQIPVIRVGLQATPTLEARGMVLAGPYHPAFRSLVESSILYDMASSVLDDLDQGEREDIRFRIAPADLSNFAGQRRENLARLKEVYGLRSIEIIPDPGMARGTVRLETPREVRVLSKGEGASLQG